MKFGVRYFLSLLILLLASWSMAAEKNIHFNLSQGTAIFRDVASSKNWSATQVAPLAFSGESEEISVVLNFSGSNKVHIFGIVLNSARDFKYDSRIRTTKRPEDERLDFRIFYEMNHYLFQNVFHNLDVAIGPQIYFNHINTLRHFSTATKLNFVENQFTAAFVLALRYSSSRNWNFRLGFSNGGLFGFERTKHNLYGQMPETNFINGWISKLNINWTWFLFRQIGFSAFIERYEGVKLGKKFQYVESDSRFGLSVVYRFGEKR